METAPITVFSWLEDLLAEAGGGPARARPEAAHAEPSWWAVSTRCEEIAAEAGGSRALLSAMVRLTNTRFEAAAAQLPGNFNDQRQLYWAASRWMLPELLPELKCRYEELSEGRRWGTLALDGGQDMRVEKPLRSCRVRPLGVADVTLGIPEPRGTFDAERVEQSRLGEPVRV